MTSDDRGLAAIEHTADGYDEIVIDLGDVHGEAPERPADDYRGLGADVEPEDEPLPAAEAWEELGSLVYWQVLDVVRVDANEAFGELATAIDENRRPTAEQVREAREALDRARAYVEDHFAPLTPGVDPWGDGVGGQVPYSAMIEQLERAGYCVERKSDN